MKKHFINIALAMILASGAALVQSCGGESGQDGEAGTEQAGAYFCPMKCEGDKTYAEAGKCPVCGMDLVTGDDMQQEGMNEEEGHDHEGHDHGTEGGDTAR